MKSGVTLHGNITYNCNMKLGFFSRILGDVIDLMPEERSNELDIADKNIDVDSDERAYDDE